MRVPQTPRQPSQSLEIIINHVFTLVSIQTIKLHRFATLKFSSPFTSLQLTVTALVQAAILSPLDRNKNLLTYIPTFHLESCPLFPLPFNLTSTFRIKVSFQQISFPWHSNAGLSTSTKSSYSFPYYSIIARIDAPELDILYPSLCAYLEQDSASLPFAKYYESGENGKINKFCLIYQIIKVRKQIATLKSGETGKYRESGFSRRKSLRRSQYEQEHFKGN